MDHGNIPMYDEVGNPIDQLKSSLNWERNIGKDNELKMRLFLGHLQGHL